ncbi:MAG: AmmeMemoRadiSam system protein B [Pseudomonadota bacterium]
MTMHIKLAATLFLVSCLGLTLPVSLANARNEAKPTTQNGQTTMVSPNNNNKTIREKKVFPSPLAGTWFTADPKKLSEEIDGYLDNVPDKSLGPISALILPHAGLQWSGQTAAYGIKQLDMRTIRRVIMLGPSHHVFMKNSASVPDATHYATPLGETPLDVDLVRELLKSPYFHIIKAANENEHSVQILLPVLQRRLAEFQFVPIVVGRLDRASAVAIADILRQHLTPDTVVIASSDFTHYGSNFDYLPFTADIQENLKKLDMGAFKRIEEKDLDGFSAYVQKAGATICGRAVIEVLLALLPAESRIQLLHYETSGAKTHDFSTSVSYLSAAVIGNWEAFTEKMAVSPGLSKDDKIRLMALAKGTLRYYLERGSAPTPEKLGIQITPGMQQIMGAFVTLKEHGNLRGCIGEITPTRPVYEAVMQRAIDSAVHDYRFSPVSKDEFEQLSFEISALTPSRSVPSYRDIVLGRDGVVLHKNDRSAVFLPQVAPEQGWSLEEMLSQLARKAGLPANAWEKGASFTVFQAIVFAENDL